MRLRASQVDLRRLRQLLAEVHTDSAAEMTSALTSVELADLLVQLGPGELDRLLSYIGSNRLADAVAELDPTEAARLILRFSRAEAADILEEMEPDDATDIVEGLQRAEAEGILAEMGAAEAEEIRELLTYPPHTAGGRMTPQFVSISPNLTVAVAMRLIRAKAPHAETIYYVYVTDRQEQLLGVVSLRELVVADPQQLIGDVMRRQVIRVPANADQEEAARLLREHNLLAIPVVEGLGRLVGVVTADDVAEVLEEEATEDIERLGGSQPLDEPYLRASPIQLFRKRVGWLMVLFLAGTYTSAVLQVFSDTLTQVVALTFFVPLLIGTGGNVGSQIVTTVVRAMAVGDVGFPDLGRILRREVAIGLTLGVVMAVAMFVRSQTMAVDPVVGLAVAAAAIVIVVWSASVAAVLPLVIRRFGVDPAVVSAPFITTLVDGTGLFLYLSIARLMLGL